VSADRDAQPQARPAPADACRAGAATLAADASRAPRGAAGLVARYAAFAALATLCNLAVQRLVLAVPGVDRGVAFAAALALGTLAGLLAKYLLDKRWIFDDRASGLGAHARRFSLYTLMGLATTAVFWGSETLFWLVWKTDAMREAGAVLGLAAGYAIKYRLDRRYVFDQAPPLPHGRDADPHAPAARRGSRQAQP